MMRMSWTFTVTIVYLMLAATAAGVAAALVAPYVCCITGPYLVQGAERLLAQYRLRHGRPPQHHH
jgi:hypothetical protein